MLNVIDEVQTISQEPPKKGRKGKPGRTPEDGNVLWRLYLELGYSDRQAFKVMLDGVPLAQTTFSKHSQVGRVLGSLEMRYFYAYREFFKDHGGHDLLDDFLNELPAAAPYQPEQL